MLLAAADRDAQYRCLCGSRRSHFAGRNQTDLHGLDVRCKSGPACGRAPHLRCVVDRMQRRAKSECRRSASRPDAEATGATATAATTTASYVAAATAAARPAAARFLPAAGALITHCGEESRALLRR